jgi:very-short-patch-repair endonuclease
VVDFASIQHRLVVELDGGQHAENSGDRRRDAWLAAEGWRVVRFWNNETLCNKDGVLEAIQIALTPSLSRKRERE